MRIDIDANTVAQDKHTGTNLLVGIAVDVSGSMEQSIQNNTGGQLSRIESFQEALKKLAKEAQDTIRENRSRNIRDSIDLFAYSFGLKTIEVCDLLSLTKSGTGISQSEADWEPAYRSLLIEAKNYNLEMWCERARSDNFFNSPREMSALARQLRSKPNKGRELERLLKAKPSLDSTFVHILLGGSEEYEMGKAFVFGDIKQAKELAKKLILEEIKDDIIAQADVTLSIEEFTKMIKADGISIDRYKDIIYGNTPMRSAMNIILKRFEKELLNRPKDTVPILLIISDGVPTDGDPSPFIESAKSMGVIVISCFVTDQDTVSPRTLFNKIEPHWSSGAKLMFNLASLLSEGTSFHRFLIEKGWKINSRSKLFVQLNHSELLEEFVGFVLCPLKLP